MARIFWDTNLFIYLFEQNPRFEGRVADIRKKMLQRGDQLYTSSLTAGEILVKPWEAGDRKVFQHYRDYFQSSGLTVIPFDLQAAVVYARIREDRTITRPDAIQLACAAIHNVNLFITNDLRLSGKVISGIDFLTSLDAAPL